MTRFLALFALCALAACGDNPPAPPPKAEPPSARPSASAPAPAPAPTAAEEAGREDAAEALRSYYARIESGDYEAAARLRSDRETDAKRLADNFKAYARYDVQVGRASRPVRAGDWLFVEVPVMITGSFKGGRTFGNAGRVTMRRAVSAESGDGGWRVYTG